MNPLKSPRAGNGHAVYRLSSEWRGNIVVVRVLAMLFIGVELGCTAARPFAYVTNYHGGSISVINVATKTVVGNPINVGGNPRAIVISPDGTRAYLVNNGAVFVIDTATDTVLGNPILIPSEGEGIAITPNGARVYVVNSGPVPCCGSVSVIDTATKTLLGSPIPVGTGPADIAVTPDGTRAYVVNEGFTSTGFVGSVSVINTATNTVSGSRIPVGIAPGAIAITPDGTHAYVANNRNGFVKDGTVSVINTATNTVVGSIFLGTDVTALSLEGIAITPDGDRAYVTCDTESTGVGAVSVIDTRTNTVSGSPIPVGRGPIGIAITSDGLRACAANDNDGTVSVIDTTTNTVLSSPVAVGKAPVDIGITSGPVDHWWWWWLRPYHWRFPEWRTWPPTWPPPRDLPRPNRTARGLTK